MYKKAKDKRLGSVSLWVAIVMLFVMIVGLSPMISLAASEVDTFESDTTGQAPAGYTVVGDHAVVSETQAYEGDKSLRIYDDSSEAIAEIVKTASASSAKVIELMIYPVTASNSCQIDIASSANSNANSVFHLGIFSDGKLKYYDGSWHDISSTGAVNFNAWNKIRIVAKDTQEAAIYINDGYSGTAENWHTFASVDRVRFMSGSTAGTGDNFYIDNVSFEEVVLSQMDTFEADTTGQAPAGYTVVGDHAQVSETQAYAGDKSLRIYDDSSEDVAEAVKTDEASSIKVVELMIYPVTASYSCQIDIASGANSNDNSVFHLGIFSDGKMKYYDGSWHDVSSAGEVTFNAWNKIRIVAKDTQEADIYINDSYSGTAENWRAFASMDRVRFMSGSGAGTGDNFYIDNVKFYSDEKDTFENDTAGQEPSGYAVVGANALVSETVSYEGIKSLRIFDDSSSVVTNAVKTSNASSAKVLEFMIYPVTATYWNQVDINSGGNSNSESIFHIGIEDDGRVKWYNGSSWTYIGSTGTVAFNAWNKVRIVAINPTNADVYVNDSYIGTAGNWNSSSTMDRVRFMSGSTAGIGDDFYIDNVRFQDYVEPEAASIVAGYLDSDTAPTTGSVENWHSTGSCEVDYQRRSIGIDCGQVMNINKIELRDSDSSTRCTDTSYTLYYSNDNISYTQITETGFSSLIRDGKVVHSFSLSGINARYYKINTTYTDTSSTFSLDNLQLSVKAFGTPTPLSSTAGYLSNDSTPISGTIGNWAYSSSLNLDYQNRSLGIDLGSQTKVNKVEICDSDITNRCTQAKYTLYWSNDNSSYTEIKGFVFNSRIENNREIQSFEFSGISARYIKIHTSFSDTSSNFIMTDLQDDVKAYALADKNYEMPLNGGYITSDSAPTTGDLDNWDYSSPVTIDNQSTSVGIDLAYPVPVNAIELWDSDTSTTVGQADYSLYQSNDNATYTQITGWTFSTRTQTGKIVHRFDFSSITARYIKVHCNASGSTFVLSDISTDIKAYSNTEAESYSEILDPQRNSEGDVINLNNGNLLMVFETYEDEIGDWQPSHLEGRISTDGGYTWGSKFVVLSNEGSINTMKASLLRMENGDIALFYQVMDSLSNCKIYMRRSSDEGQTWGARLCVTSSPAGYYIMNGGRVTRLSTGRILVPVSYSIDMNNAMGGNGAVSRCYYSDDDGLTWTMGTGYVQLNNGALEPGVTELSNGDILMNMRTRVVGKIYKSISTDGGVTWSSPVDMGFGTPSAPSTIKRVPATGDLVIFFNNTFSTTNYPRNPLTIAMSKDEGQTWTIYKNLDEANDSDDLYAYLSCRFIGRKAILSYTENWENKIRIVDIDWFYGN